MDLSRYCSVAEACRLAGVSDGYMRRLIREGRISGHRFGNSYAVLRADAEAFQRQPGMGRPRRDRAGSRPAVAGRKVKKTRGR